MEGTDTVRVRDDAVVLRPHGDDLLVYEFLQGGFYLLNRSGRLILDQVDGRRTAAEVAARVVDTTDGSISTDDVAEMLADLAALDVVEFVRPESP